MRDIPLRPWLTDKAKNITSKFGEDGLIEATLAKVGVVNRWCFEVGAGNGNTFSNTFTLRKQGWDAVLIEGDPKSVGFCREYRDEKVRVLEEWIDPRSLDRILAECGAPYDLDFGSLDIDGQDFWVWAGLQEYKPRVMLVEFSPYKEDDQMPALDDPGEGAQAGIDRIVDLGVAKGYVPLAKTFVNVLFARRELIDD